MNKKSNWLKTMSKLSDVQVMFDMICFRNYIFGQSNNNLPIDESREAFKIIKRKLKHDSNK